MPIITYFKIGALIILLAALYGAKVYYYKTQDQLVTLRANEIVLKTAIKTSQEAIKTMQFDIKQSAILHNNISQEFQQARKENDRLKALLGRHDLGYLAHSKPSLITNHINKGTRDAARCLEIASGAPLTKKERNATKRSQINTSCPSLANPKYKGKK